MTSQIPQPAFWTGPPEWLPDAFRFTKAKGVHTLTGVCEVWSNPLGWELRLAIGGHEWLTTTVVRSAEDLTATTEHWRSALLTKGWS